MIQDLAAFIAMIFLIIAVSILLGVIHELIRF